MQRRYILDLLGRTNMLDAKTVSTPMQTTPKLTLKDSPPLSDASQYRSIVGSLQYLAFTRPDISYAVNRLSQFMHQPTECHWQAVKRVLRYLAGTPSHGVYMKKGSPLTLHAFTDADWAGDSDDYVSTNSYVIYLGSTPVSWSSKKQNGVARSSTKQNTEQSRTQLLKFDGYARYFKNLVSNYLSHRSYIVIMLVQRISALTRCFTQG